MITRRMTTLLHIALVMLLILLSNTSRAQKNTLRVWVDTLIIDEGVNDVTLDVKYKLTVQRPPVKFYGYKAEIDYGPAGYVTVVGGDAGVIFQNTGSRHISDPITDVTNSQIVVVALGSESQRIDTTYSALFKLRLTTSNLPPGERALFIWDYIQLVDDTGIDDVIYGEGYVEKRKFVPPPVFDTVRIYLPAYTVRADSVFDVPVVFDSISGSKLKHFAFSFDFDSSVVRLDDVILASGLPDTLEREIQPTHGDVFLRVAGDGVFTGADTLFYLRFTAKHRTDTMCTVLQQAGFIPINTDAKVDATVITIGEICVQGEKPEEPKEVVEAPEAFRGLSVSPNPASDVVRVALPGRRFNISIFDVTGRAIYGASGFGSVEWRPEEEARGSYYIAVRCEGKLLIRQVIIK